MRGEPTHTEPVEAPASGAAGRGGRTLFLHVGHGKTGSSFIQSLLQRNADLLCEAGIFYPSMPNAAEVAEGQTSMGNGALLERGDALPALPAGCESVVFSSEKMFRILLEPDFSARVDAAAAFYGCTRISVLLFIRDPIGMLGSRYQQAVKNSGDTATVGRHARNYTLPELVLAFLTDVAARPRTVVTVRNYSRCKNRLTEEVVRWLERPDLALEPVPRTVVNRSLTLAELAFQRGLNQHLGACGQLAATPLGNRLPDIPSSVTVPTLEEQRGVLARLAPAMEAVNALVEPEHRYVPDLIEPEPPSEREQVLGLSQIEVLADSVGREILRLRTQAGELKAANKALRQEQRAVKRENRELRSERKALVERQAALEAELRAQRGVARRTLGERVHAWLASWRAGAAVSARRRPGTRSRAE